MSKTTIYVMIAAAGAIVAYLWWRGRQPGSSAGAGGSFIAQLQNSGGWTAGMVPAPLGSGGGGSPGVTAKSVVSTAAGAGAAGVCAAYGAGVASPLCAAGGAYLGGKAYQAGSGIVDKVGDLWNSIF